MTEYENEDLILLNTKISPGESKTLNFSIAKLYTSTKIEIPVIVERAAVPGPTVLITAGIHGDEINGVEVVRQFIAKKMNRPKRGTIICIPILNIFGFLNAQREFPDGKDLNRKFPGTKHGSLASRVAYHFTKEIVPYADYCLDFHTGGASRFNAAQIRVQPNDAKLLELAKVFNPPFIVFSDLLKKSYRATCHDLNIPSLLFEGGKSLESDKQIAKHGVHGILRVLKHLDMLQDSFEVPTTETKSVLIEKSKWLRAQKSGLLHVKVPCHKHVVKGEFLATITDPYGTMRFKVLSPNDGYIINVNQSPIIYQGDAIFHISTENTTITETEQEDF